MSIGTELNFSIRQGEDEIFETDAGAFVYDSDGVALDLTAMTEMVFAARKQRASTNAIEIDLASGQWTLFADGTFSLDLAAADTNVETGTYTYQIVATDGSGDVSTLYYGVLTVVGTIV